MDAQDWARLGMWGENQAMMWYVITHPGSQLPAPAPGGEIDVPGVRATFNPNLLIIGLIVIGAIVVLR